MIKGTNEDGKEGKPSKVTQKCDAKIALIGCATISKYLVAHMCNYQ